MNPGTMQVGGLSMAQSVTLWVLPGAGPMRVARARSGWLETKIF
jgi:hypothetical protein